MVNYQFNKYNNKDRKVFINNFYIKYLYLYICVFLSNFNFITTIVADKGSPKNLSLCEIVITIRGKGTQQILNDKVIQFYEPDYNRSENYTFLDLPSEIFVNKNKINYIDYYVYNLSSEVNNITLKFNKSSINCNVMFYGLSNITEIKFINFYIIRITNTSGMFCNCYNLKSLNMTKLDTYSVTRMDYMFSNCYNLMTLDLRSFNTESIKNMAYTFYNCTKLMTLDLRYFDTGSVTTMKNMFYGCENLVSLVLSNFYAQSVTTMENMFYGCKNLISLDLRKLNLNTKSLTTMNNMFYLTYDNLVYCLDYPNDIFNWGHNILPIFETENNNLNLSEYINSSNYTFKNNSDCSYICFNENHKILFEEKKCVLNCSGNFIYNNFVI